ncbi:MAG: hypothetical protein QM485_15635 [Flavobacteriaceae bacterium]
MSIIQDGIPVEKDIQILILKKQLQELQKDSGAMILKKLNTAAIPIHQVKKLRKWLRLCINLQEVEPHS